MKEIVTDKTFLRKISVPVNDDALSLIESLRESIPDNGLGLSAPQIGELKQVFIARLSKGFFAFVNPEIIDRSPDTVPSVEGCLSIPDVQKCVTRHHRITVKATIYDVKCCVRVDFDQISLSGLDSFIVQHEYDHLNGILIVDHESAITPELKVELRQKNRIMRIQKKRENRKNRTTRPQKISAKRQKRIQKMMKTERKRTKKLIKIQEQLSADRENLFN